MVETKSSLTTAPGAAGRSDPPMLPALVVLVGLQEQEAERIKDNVTTRLLDWGERGAVRWIIAPQVPDVQAIEETCKMLGDIDLWQWLAKRKYISDLPVTGSAYSVRVIIVVDSTRHSFDLDTLAAAFCEARKNLEQQMRITEPALLWIGDPPNRAKTLRTTFWPRFRMHTVAAGGLNVKHDRILEAVEHLVVALLSSDVQGVIETELGDKRDNVLWLVAGASALISRLDRIGEAVHEIVVEKIITRLLDPILEREEQRVDEFMRTRAQEAHKRLLDAAKFSLEHGKGATQGTASLAWKLETDDKGTVTQCSLQNERLLDAVFGPYRGGIPASQPRSRSVRERLVGTWRLLSVLSKPLFRPNGRWERFQKWKQALTEELEEHYRLMWKALELWGQPGDWRGVGGEAAKIWKEWQELIGGFMDRGFRTHISQGSVWYEPGLPAGLLAAWHALLSLERHLAGRVDLQKKRGAEVKAVSPLPIAEMNNTEEDQDYFSAMAVEDADIVSGYQLRYEHFARTVASPWGALLSVFPAWPLGAILASIVLGWSMARALVWVGVVLFGVVMLAMFYEWIVKGKRYLDRLQRNMYEHLLSRVCTVVARVLRDYRWWLLTQLREREFVMREMWVALAKRQRQARERSEHILNSLQPKNSVTYVLGVDKANVVVENVCDRIVTEISNLEEWRYLTREEGTRRVYKYEDGVTGLLVENLWGAQRPISPTIVLGKLEQEVAEHTRRNVQGKPDLWMPGIFAQNVEELRGGNRLVWLMHGAHPLGRVDKPLLEIDMLLGHPSMLEGGEIRQSPAYRPNIRFPATRQSHEEICVRILVEGKVDPSATAEQEEATDQGTEGEKTPRDRKASEKEKRTRGRSTSRTSGRKKAK